MAKLFDDANSEFLESQSFSIADFPFTMSCWFYPDDGTNDGVVFSVADKDVEADRHALFFRGSISDKLQLFVSGVSPQTETTTSANLNAWNHALGTIDGKAIGDITVYLNGGGSASNSDDSVSEASTQDTISIGRLGDSTPSSYFSGRIAEAAIWDVILNAGEIASLAAGYSPSLVHPASIIHYWPLIRTDIDIVGGLSITGTAPDVAEHPPIIRPSLQILPFPAFDSGNIVIIVPAGPLF